MRNFEPADYKTLGFKSGLEIHQQLFTEKKLFCRCPAGKYSEEYDCEILRHMRPTLSELGEYDGTALMEFKTQKNVIYRLNSETVCTYEMDDTPPFMVNPQAVDQAIQISAMLNLNIVDELHIVRKQYLDGSIPTGFQRTGIIGLEGEVPISNKTIRMIQLSIEEDSCREVSDEGHTITFRTDRLGMPLIEAVTYPDMETPWEVADAAYRIGRAMRVTGNVRRGHGSVRQDVNVSITGGTRIEIKGVPRIAFIPALTHYEALRQKALLEIKAEFVKRLGSKDQLIVERVDLTPYFKKILPQHDLFISALEENGVIWGTKVKGVGDLLTYPTQPNLTFADEIKGRIRVIACIDTQPIIMHTKDFPEYRGSDNDLAVIMDAVGALAEDEAVVVYAGSEKDCRTAHQEIELRLLDAFDGVPSETRQPRLDGTTDFERILPGPDRMYPDTDHPPVCLSRERVNNLLAENPPFPWDKDTFYKGLGIADQVARLILDIDMWKMADSLIEQTHVSPSVIASALTQYYKVLRKKGLDINQLTLQDWLELMHLLENKQIYKEVIPYLLEQKLQQIAYSFQSLAEKNGWTPATEVEVQAEIDALVKEPFTAYSKKCHPPDIKQYHYIMGKIMHTFRGRVDGAQVAEWVKKRM